ncbi:MAG TPA: hypothetical protein VN316_01175 [candidate division Zixibacteria bacterium]|nr:hypothetical protein [candidate division Zixibacteria bacterium]
MADEFVCLETPDDFMAVCSDYQVFAQVTDEDVVEILEKLRSKKNAKIH